MDSGEDEKEMKRDSTATRRRESRWVPLLLCTQQQQGSDRKEGTGTGWDGMGTNEPEW